MNEQTDKQRNIRKILLLFFNSYLNIKDSGQYYGAEGEGGNPLLQLKLSSKVSSLI
jgi:hypothetical protein